ncbi:hypothetical protein [Mobilicoccus massiliensis]|uniref:hypothetical protein n=1 Tax=Mobilicoccus massiliensis TaxID=1522310 RepID=UPI000A8C9F68|nr:hypothetical protein [Mobilicoccus massiliensis]
MSGLPELEAGMASIAALPEALFHIDASPAALRASAVAYGVFASHAVGAQQAVESLTVPSWAGSEGELYRRRLASYAPMPAAAQESFARLHRVVDELAGRLEDLDRRMTVLRGAARIAWQRWDEARAYLLARAGDNPLLRLDPTLSGPGPTFRLPGLPPGVGDLRREYEAYEEQARHLHRLVAQAAQEAATAIDLVSTPPEMPAPVSSTAVAGSAFGPSVVGRTTSRLLLGGTVGAVAGEFGAETQVVELSDGTWETRVTLDGYAGGRVGWQAPWLGDSGGTHGGSGPAGPSGGAATTPGLAVDLDQRELGAEAAAGLSTGATLIWVSTSKAEAERKLAEAGRILATHPMLTPQTLARRLAPDGIATTAAVQARAEARGGLGETAVGAHLQGRIGVGREVRRDGSVTTSFEVGGSVGAEHPVVDKGVRQQTYGAGAGFKAAVRTDRSGAGVLTVTTRTDDPKSGTYVLGDKSRRLTPAEVKQLDRAAADLATGGLDGPSADTRRALDLLRQTAEADPLSPEVQSGQMDYRRQTYGTRSDGSPFTVGVGPLELEVGAERTEEFALDRGRS